MAFLKSITVSEFKDHLQKGLNKFESIAFNFHPLFSEFNFDNYIFINCVFEAKLTLKGHYKFKDIQFENCGFNGVDIQTGIIEYSIKFYNSTFTSESIDNSIVIQNVKLDNFLTFSNCESDSLKIQYITSTERAAILISELSHQISNTKKSIKEISINNCREFNGSILLQILSDFSKSISITNSIFNNDFEIQFIELNEIRLYQCVFNKKFRIYSSFSKIKYNIKALVITVSKFNSFVSINGLRVNKINLRDIQSQIPFSFDKIKIKKGYPESFRFLKHESLRKNDSNEALEFYKSEKLSLLKRDYKKIGYGNLLLLGLNWLSNDFDTDWLRGVFFTIISSSIIFGVYIFTLSTNLELAFSLSGIKYIWTNYASDFWYFFNPAHKPFSVTDLRPTFLGGAIDLLGRITVVYGSYQTAQAFRKFGRK